MHSCVACCCWGRGWPGLLTHETMNAVEFDDNIMWPALRSSSSFLMDEIAEN